MGKLEHGDNLAPIGFAEFDQVERRLQAENPRLAAALGSVSYLRDELEQALNAANYDWGTLGNINKAAQDSIAHILELLRGKIEPFVVTARVKDIIKIIQEN